MVASAQPATSPISARKDSAKVTFENAAMPCHTRVGWLLNQRGSERASKQANKQASKQNLPCIRDSTKALSTWW